MLSFALSAQNYQLFNANRIALYREGSGVISQNIQIDSVKEVNGDSVFYPSRKIRAIKYNCYNPYSPSWLGKRIVVKSNGSVIFYDTNDSALVFKPQANLGENWKILIFSNGSYYKASVVKQDTMTFLSTNDSVKVLEISHYSVNNTKIATLYSEVILSKEYGLVIAPNFYQFGKQSLTDSEERLYNLVGLSSPTLGVQNITYKDIFNFDVGDEFHKESHYNSYSGGKYSETKEFIWEKVLSKNIIVDTIFYEIEVLKDRSYFENFSLIQHILYKDTLQYRYFYWYNYLDPLPGATAVIDGFFSSHKTAYVQTMLAKSDIDVMKSIDRPVKIEAIQNNQYWDNSSSDSCLKRTTYGGCETQDNYIKGLGGPYHWGCENGTLDGSSHVLVYYKKGSEEWGKPLKLSVEENSLKSITNVYPNPSEGKIFFVFEVNTSFPLNVVIFNEQGKELKQIQLQNNNEQLELDVANGLYFYSISNEESIVGNGKIVILK